MQVAHSASHPGADNDYRKQGQEDTIDTNQGVPNKIRSDLLPMKKPVLALSGGRGKPITLKELTQMVVALTGRQPTRAELASARKKLAAHASRQEK